MKGLGTLVNIVTVLAGSSLGMLIGRRLPERIRQTVLIEAAGAGTAYHVTIHEGGEIAVRGAGSTATVGGPLYVLDGTIGVDDGGMVAADYIDVDFEGTLQGNNGVIDPNSPIVNNGFILPGGYGAGTLTIDGGLSHDAGGVLSVELGGATAGTEYDVLVVTEDVTLSGGLVVDLIDDYDPPGGSTFEVLTADTLSGTFAYEVVPTFPDERGMVVTYTPTSVQLTVEGLVIPGDLDGDGDVDLNDLAILLASYGIDAGGDIDGDGDTDLSDLAILLSHYGEGT